MLQHGVSLVHARVASILLHGRGGSPEDMVSLADEWRVPDVAYLAPAASNHTWYPQSFLAPIAQNEPGLSSALRVLEGLLESLAVQGIGSDRVLIVGFSQGACLGLGTSPGTRSDMEELPGSAAGDRPTGVGSQRRGVVERNARLAGMQRRRSAHSTRARSRIG